MKRSTMLGLMLLADIVTIGILAGIGTPPRYWLMTAAVLAVLLLGPSAEFLGSWSTLAPARAAYRRRRTRRPRGKAS
jgi:hypothetical protein